MAPTKRNMTPEEAEYEGATFDERWRYDLEHGVISIGWGLGEAPTSLAHLARLWDTWAPSEWENREHGLRMLRYFWFDIQPGDVVVARAGVNQYVGAGVFRGEPWYDETAYAGTGIRYYYSFRRVDWTSASGPRRPSPIRFGQNTLYPLTSDKVAVLRDALVLPRG